MGDRVVLVAGGAGHAGGCAVRALLDRGATVIVPSRTEERLASVYDNVPVEQRSRLHLIRADIADPDEAELMRGTVLGAHRGLDAVVASLGTFERKTLIRDLDRPTWERLIFDNLTPHFVCARTFAPVLADSGGVYITLAGITSNEPMTCAAPNSVAGAGLRMFLSVLAAEYEQTSLRCHEVTLLAPIMDHWFGYPSQPGWLTADEVGSFLADVIEPDFSRPDEMLLSLPEATSPRVWRRPTPPQQVTSGAS